MDTEKYDKGMLGRMTRKVGELWSAAGKPPCGPIVWNDVDDASWQFMQTRSKFLVGSATKREYDDAAVVVIMAWERHLPPAEE